MALVAIDVLGLSYREAARALRVREATITTRLFRARRQVAQRLSDEAPGEAREDATAPAADAARAESALARGERMRASGVIPSRDLP
jgi:predicted RNA polymerase sigma factor